MWFIRLHWEQMLQTNLNFYVSVSFLFLFTFLLWSFYMRKRRITQQFSFKWKYFNFFLYFIFFFFFWCFMIFLTAKVYFIWILKDFVFFYINSIKYVFFRKFVFFFLVFCFDLQKFEFIVVTCCQRNSNSLEKYA